VELRAMDEIASPRIVTATIIAKNIVLVIEITGTHV